ncbi:phage tail protein [bacterium]|nr:phage tail protein [bacterium]
MIVQSPIQYKDALRDLNWLEKEQLPFAFAQTLTQVAKDAQGAVQRRTRRQFDLHGEFIPRGIRITAARKGDLKRYGIAQADVHTADRISSFMPHHERGEKRFPRGRRIAVPGADLRKKAYRTGSGKVRARWKPARLLQDYEGPHTGGRSRADGGTRKRRTAKAFLMTMKGGKLAIVRRRGRDRRPLDVLYWLVRSADIRRGWRFEETVKMTVEHSNMAGILQRNLTAAMATRRG